MSRIPVVTTLPTQSSFCPTCQADRTHFALRCLVHSQRACKKTLAESKFYNKSNTSQNPSHQKPGSTCLRPATVAGQTKVDVEPDWVPTGGAANSVPVVAVPDLSGCNNFGAAVSSRLRLQSFCMLLLFWVWGWRFLRLGLGVRGLGRMVPGSGFQEAGEAWKNTGEELWTMPQPSWRDYLRIVQGPS